MTSAMEPRSSPKIGATSVEQPLVFPAVDALTVQFDTPSPDRLDVF